MERGRRGLVLLEPCELVLLQLASFLVRFQLCLSFLEWGYRMASTSASAAGATHKDSQPPATEFTRRWCEVLGASSSTLQCEPRLSIANRSRSLLRGFGVPMATRGLGPVVDQATVRELDGALARGGVSAGMASSGFSGALPPEWLHGPPVRRCRGGVTASRSSPRRGGFIGNRARLQEHRGRNKLRGAGSQEPLLL